MSVLGVEVSLIGLTWRLLLGRRRWLALFVGAALPWGLAAVFMMQEGRGEAEVFLAGLAATLIITALLPIAALVYGTAAFGQEIEDGTLAFVLAKPVARWRVVFAKLVAALAATTATIVPGIVLAGWTTLGGPFHPMVRGLVVGVELGGLLYAGAFMALSLFTRRALIVGLIYVIGWEGSLSRVLVGTRTLSIREYTTSVAEAAAGTPFPDVFASPIALSTSLWLSASLLLASFVLATRKVRRIELLEEI